MARLNEQQRTELRQRAEELARLPYSITIDPDECDGRLCYVARHPELAGCMAQGWTPEEAVLALREARQLCIASYLEYGQAVPPPHAAGHLQELARLAA